MEEAAAAAGKSEAMDVTTLDYGQFQTVYNILSFALASMIATTVFLLVANGRVLPRYRQAVIVSAIVTLIAASTQTCRNDRAIAGKIWFTTLRRVG